MCSWGSGSMATLGTVCKVSVLHKNVVHSYILYILPFMPGFTFCRFLKMTARWRSPRTAACTGGARKTVVRLGMVRKVGFLYNASNA